MCTPTTQTSCKRGKKGKTSIRTRTALIRKARKGGYKAKMLRDHFQLPLSIRRVQQILSSEKYCEFGKLKSRPKLTKENRENRLKWAEEFSKFPASYWDNVIFSDEKRFLNCRTPALCHVPAKMMGRILSVDK